MPYSRSMAAILATLAMCSASSTTGLEFTLLSTEPLMPTEAQSCPYLWILSTGMSSAVHSHIDRPAYPRSTESSILSQWSRIRYSYAGFSLRSIPAPARPRTSSLWRAYTPYIMPDCEPASITRPSLPSKMWNSSAPYSGEILVCTDASTSSYGREFAIQRSLPSCATGTGLLQAARARAEQKAIWNKVFFIISVCFSCH